jgi:hypothetical protein
VLLFKLYDPSTLMPTEVLTLGALTTCLVKPQMQGSFGSVDVSTNTYGEPQPFADLLASMPMCNFFNVCGLTSEGLLLLNFVGA